MSTVTESGPFERVVTMTLTEEALAAGRQSAARRLAREVKVKGFRPGKAPLKVVESMVGKETLRKEAIDDALQRDIASVLEEHDLSPVVPPRLTDIRDEGGEVEVDVLVTLWPTPERLPDFEGRRVSIELPDVTENDVDEQIDRMRNQFAELEDVSREGFDGDYALIDVTTTLDDEEFAPGSATDLLYEVGSSTFLDGLDEELRGKGAGEMVRFQSTLPEGIGEDAGKEVSVRALVKQIKAKRLPELTDEWVTEVSEFETVDEMRSELREQMSEIRRRSAWRHVEDRALAEMIEDLDVALPEPLVEAEMDSVFHRFAHRLEEQSIPFDQYLAVTGQDQQAFVDDLRSQAELNLRTRILLEAVAESEGIEVTPEELEEAVTALAAAARVSRDDYRKALSEGGRELALAGDILRRKAVDRILDSVVPVSADGTELDLPPRQGEAEADDGDDEADEDAVPDENDDGQEPAEVDE